MLKCYKKNGLDFPKCQQLKLNAISICPAEQYNAFYEARRDDKW